jgi:peptidoglycan/LPS O-acetylase OafA/YrhL
VILSRLRTRAARHAVVEPTSPNSATGHAGRVGNGLDLLRSVAALLVFVYHIRLYTDVDFVFFDPVVAGGRNGVIVFFVLSGYLIYRPFLTEARPRLVAFAIRRIARLLPAYLVVIAAMALMTGDRLGVEHPVQFALLLQNYDPDLFKRFLVPSWTLPIEVAFYATLPLIAVVLARLARGSARRHVLLLAMLGELSVIAAAATLVVLLASGFSAIEFALALYPLMLWAFVPGMIVAVCSVTRPDVIARLSGRRWVAVGVGLLLTGLIVNLSWADVITAAGAALLVGASVGAGHGHARWLRWWFWPASLSYGFYLWHWPVLGLFVGGAPGWSVALAAFGVSVAAAAVSYLAVERPFIELGRRVTLRMGSGTRQRAVPSPVPLRQGME